MPFLVTDKIMSNVFPVIGAGMPKVCEKLLNLVAPFKDVNGKLLAEGCIVRTENGLSAVLRYGPYYAPEELSDTTDKFMQEGWGWYLEVGALDHDDKSKLSYYNHVPCCAATTHSLCYISNMLNNQPIWWQSYRQFVFDTQETLQAKYPDKTRMELAATEGFTDLFIPHCHVCGDAFDDDANAPKRYMGLSTYEAQQLFMTHRICLNCLTKGGYPNGV